MESLRLRHSSQQLQPRHQKPARQGRFRASPTGATGRRDNEKRAAHYRDHDGNQNCAGSEGMSTTWQEVKLESVIREEREPIGSFDGYSLPVLGVTNVEGVTHTGIEASDDKSKYLRLRPNRFVFNPYRVNVGSLGLTSSSQEGIASPAYVIFRATDTLDSHFLYYFLKSRRGNQLINFHGNRGSVRSALRFADLCQMEIPLPPLSEQQRIVARIEELVAKIDAARTLRQQAIEEAEALSWSAKTKAFPTPNGSTVGSYVRFQTGYAFKSEWFTKEGVRLARNANVGHGELDWSETVRLPESCRSEFGKFELEEDDILVSLDRPIISTGVKVARVKPSDLPSLLLQRVARAQ